MVNSIDEKADTISLTHFMNSFLRDFYEDKRVSLCDRFAKVELLDGELKIPLLKKSMLGSHIFKGELTLNDHNIDLKLLAKYILTNFTENKDQEFIKNIINSRDNIRLFLSQNDERKITSYLQSEQQLIEGHPFHPYPKSKNGMELSDIIKYSPELSGQFCLLWIEVKPSLFSSDISPENYKELSSSMREFDLNKKSDSLFLPMHPWQWEKIKNKIDSSLIENIHTGKNKFSALSSMRTVYNENSPYQLKFSMNIKLTNSIRHLLPQECKRGRQIESIFESEKILENIANFSIQYEGLYFSLKDKSGNDLIESTVQFRNNLKIKTSQRVELLSTFCEKIHTPYTWAQRKKWFSHFLNNIIKPFIEIQTKYGILLGAHMQNILIHFENELPKSVTFRDCQGTGFSEKGYQKYHTKFKSINKEDGNVLKSEDVNKVFGYYLIVNTVFSTISALAKSDSIIEEQLLLDMRSFLYEIKNEFNKEKSNDLSFIDFLLTSKNLFQKGNMRCSLNNINENTASKPWEIYNQIENPLLKLREINFSRKGVLYSEKIRRNKTLSFRVLEKDDLDIFHKWHHKEYVSKFWEMNLSKQELLNYIEQVKSSTYKLPLILEVDNNPVGYFEAYWAYEDRIAPYCNPDLYDRGIHMLIGEEKYLRTTLILDSTYHISKFLLEEHPKTNRVWGEPRADNRNIKLIANKLPGWKVLEDFDFPHKRATLLECEKSRFYKESCDSYS